MATGAILLTEASPGAPRNSGTNGDLCGVMDWALLQAGWTIEYTSGNARVYRPPSGNRFRLHINHDSTVSGDARLAVVRGCENASDATTLVDPFPTAAQRANAASHWKISSVASTTSRNFIIIVSPTFVIYLTNFSGTANQWDGGMFGDVWRSRPEDTWNTICSVRIAGAAATTSIWQQIVTTDTNVSAPQVYWARDITGTNKSTLGAIYATASGGSGMGIINNAPAAGAGYQGEVMREVACVTDIAVSSGNAGTNTLFRRGAIPNLWAPLHNGRGVLTDADTFTDTSYSPSSVFRALGTGTTNFIIIEESDTSVSPF